MPIEIKELVIRTTVVPEQQTSQQIVGANAGIMNDDIKDELIQVCINQVMSILEQQKER